VASVDKRPNGTYRARWYPFPGSKQRTKAFERKVDAERFLALVQGDIARGSYVDPNAGRQSFEAFADEWAAAQDWKDLSRESWGYARKRLMPILGDRQLSSIDQLVLQSAQQALRERYARNATVLTMSYAKSIMKAACATGRIGRDPTIGVRRPKVRDDEPRDVVRPEDVPTKAEVQAILGGAPPRFRAAIALGANGLRVGEVLGFSEDAIDFDLALVVVRQQLQRIGSELTLTTVKGEKRRTIVVPSRLLGELRRHLRHCGRSGLLFRGGRGALMRRDDFYRQAWRPALRGAGCRLTGSCSMHSGTSVPPHCSLRAHP
jgi:integrase